MTIASLSRRAVAAALALALAAPPLALDAAMAEGDTPRLRGQVTEPGGGEAAADEPPQDRRQPPPPRRMPEVSDPYAPLGIRLGSFLLFPSLELRSGYSDNVGRRAENPLAGPYGRAMPAIEMRSDWRRHELRGRASASYRRAGAGDAGATTAVDAELGGRLDIRTGFHADLRVSYVREPSSRRDPNVLPAAVDELDVERLRGEGALTHRVGRTSIRLRGAVQKTAYDSDGLAAPGALDYRTEEAGVRASYELVEGAALFVEAGGNRRRYALAPVAGEPRRGSRGYEALAGVEMRLSGLITGELGIGYQRQKPDDAVFPVIEGAIFRSALRWEPTALTTLSLTASLTPEEASLEPLAAGARVAAADLTLAHAFRRNLIATLTLGYSRTGFVGVARRDTQHKASLGVEYMVSRELAFVAEAAQERHRSNLSDDYEENRIEVGVRLRR